MSNEKLNIIAALRKATHALKTLSEKDFKTEERKAFALAAFHECNQAEFFNPEFGDYFAWTEDEDFGGSDVATACNTIEDFDPYMVVQLTRVVRLPDVYVTQLADGTYETFDTEEEADARATAAEEAAASEK